MTAHDGLTGHLEGIVETLLGSMAQVNHDAQTVHLADDLATEGADAIVCLTAASRVADVVVAIMAQRHIDNATLGKVI